MKLSANKFFNATTNIPSRTIHTASTIDTNPMPCREQVKKKTFEREQKEGNVKAVNYFIERFLLLLTLYRSII